PSGQNANPVSQEGQCSRVLSVGKYLLLSIIIPPFLNYASLQREGLLLQPEGGQLIDVGLGQKMYLTCKGTGQPLGIQQAPAATSLAAMGVQHDPIVVSSLYKELVPYLQTLQFSAASGLSRLLLIAGWMQPPITGENISEDLIRRQKYLLSNPAHQSSSVDEHFFLNESVSQVREIATYKPLSSRTSVSVITGDYYDALLPAHLNMAVEKFQEQLLAQTYPSAKQIKIPGADRKMIYKKPYEVSKHLMKLVKQKKPKQESQ
ncbi:UNVERIFIED_CONTAM: hypothetical protein FKN15_011754, partial [Acipenser sinensis]